MIASDYREVLMSTVRERRSDCAVAGTLDVLGDRWSLLIVRDLFLRGELRFADLADAAEAIPTNTLTDRLRRLQDSEILIRRQYEEHPPRYAYRLTDRGRALGPVLDALADWGVEHLPGTRRLGVEVADRSEGS
jgi:DNA-binding HxlR family transcriptional regulator